MLKDTWSAMVPTFRILCLSDVAPMWYHYGDKYHGVVLADTRQSRLVSQPIAR
jgi:hypothetical protein